MVASPSGCLPARRAALVAARALNSH